MVMVKGEQNHRKTIDVNGSRRKKPSYPIAPKKCPLFTSNCSSKKVKNNEYGEKRYSNDVVKEESTYLMLP